MLVRARPWEEGFRWLNGNRRTATDSRLSNDYSRQTISPHRCHRTSRGRFFAVPLTQCVLRLLCNWALVDYDCTPIFDCSTAPSVKPPVSLLLSTKIGSEIFLELSISPDANNNCPRMSTRYFRSQASVLHHTLHPAEPPHLLAACNYWPSFRYFHSKVFS